MDNKLKKIIAREGLVLLSIVLACFIIGISLSVLGYFLEVKGAISNSEGSELAGLWIAMSCSLSFISAHQIYHLGN